MPHDGKAVQVANVVQLPVAIDGTFQWGHEGLRQIARMLRTEVQPKNFQWDFHDTLKIHKKWSLLRFRQVDCGTQGCALGWAHLKWPEANLLNAENDHLVNDAVAKALAKRLNITATEFYYIFAHEANTDACYLVTPTVVANRIDEVLAKYS